MKPTGTNQLKHGEGIQAAVQVFGSWSLSRSIALIVVIIGAAVQAWLCSIGRVPESLVVSAAALAILIVCYSFDRGSYTSLATSSRTVEVMLLMWFVATPFASFYLKYPSEQSLLTFDRIAITTVGLLVLIQRAARSRILKKQIGESPTGQAILRSTSAASALEITPFEVLWALLTTAAIVSVLVKSQDFGFSLKIAVDSFALPLVVFHIARNHFFLERRGAALLLAAIALAYFLLSCGLVEILTKINLFPYKGSLIIREAEVRVNGPYASDSSYAIISLLLGIFLLELPGMMGLRLDKSARLAHLLAAAAALISSCLPLYRVIPISIVLCIFALSLLKRGVPARSDGRFGFRTRVGLHGLSFRAIALPLVITIIAGITFYVVSSTNSRLANPENAFSRLATWQAALKVAADHPVAGVGLWNYSDYLQHEYARESWSIEDALETRIATTPHSNPLWIAAELGLVGFLPYLLANFFLVMYGLRKLRSSTEPRTRTAAACYLSLLAAYWIPGLTLTSGAYSDLNLCFFFLIGLISGFLKRSESQAPEAFTAAAGEENRGCREISDHRKERVTKIEAGRDARLYINFHSVRTIVREPSSLTNSPASIHEI